MTDAATTTATAEGAQAQAQPTAPAAPTAPTPADLAAAHAALQGAPAPVQEQPQETQPPVVNAPNPNAPDMSGWPQAAIDAYNRRDADAVRYQREAGDQRIQTKQNGRDEGLRQAALAIAKAAGIELPSEEPVTVEAVTEQLGGVTSERDEARRQAAVTMAAWQQGADPAKLGYLQYTLTQDSAYGALDPTAADFSDKLSAIVAGKIANDPTLKAAGTAQVSGVESLGGASGNSAITQEQFNAMSVADRTTLYVNDRATYDRLTAGQY